MDVAYSLSDIEAVVYPAFLGEGRGHAPASVDSSDRGDGDGDGDGVASAGDGGNATAARVVCEHARRFQAALNAFHGALAASGGDDAEEDDRELRAGSSGSAAVAGHWIPLLRLDLPVRRPATRPGYGHIGQFMADRGFPQRQRDDSSEPPLSAELAC